ncbi:MAG: 4Fe-4S binding protein [Phycisphaerae bacterium]|nr:4Fe-4S binding protein [Phycisphaerae bacterium]
MSPPSNTAKAPPPRIFPSGRVLLVLSLLTRVGVLLLLCLLAMWTDYLNLKQGYNNPRLVELASGKTARVFYEYSDAFFSTFGDPMQVAQSSGGMPWSLRVMGVPFTDPVAALSVAARDHHWELGFALGLIVPLGLALIFGRVFCSYVCPASLLFFTTARIRRLLEKFFWLPDVRVNRGAAWGILFGGLLAVVLFGYGIWTLLLPYFAIGQTIFHSIAFETRAAAVSAGAGILTATIGAIVVFSLLDLLLGRQFTCRYLCPTGRLLGFIGRRSVLSVRRDASRCLSGCHSCNQICPLGVKPKIDESVDCSLCGECMIICPTQCLSVGVKKA